jgi:hypothetical protein
MKLAELAAKPQLVKLTIADEDIVKKHGEPLEFWVYDRYDMDTFMKLATINEENFSEIAKTVMGMIYDEDGKQLLSDKDILPMDVTTKVIQNVVDFLGNAVSQTIEA